MDGGVDLVTLDNGLRVVVERRRSSVAGLAIAVRAGSYFEPRGLEGIAHLAEHMLFRSNECMTSDEIERTVELSGGYANAYTSRDHMVVYTEVTSGALARVARVLYCMLASRSVVVEEFESEKEVVKREIEGYVADDRSWILRLAMRAIYGPAAGRPVEGFADSVDRISPEDLVAFRERHFNAANAVAAVSGGVGEDELREVLSILGRLPEGRPLEAEPPPPEPGDVVEERGSMTAQVAVAWLLPGLRELGSKVWDVDVALFNLGSGATSALYSLLRRDLSLVYSYEVVDVFEPDRAAVVIVAEDVAKERVEEAVEALSASVWSKLRSLLTDEEYVAGRRRLLRYILRPERLSLAEEAVRNAVRLLYGLDPVTYEERLARLEAADWRFTDIPGLARATARALIV